MAGEPQLSVPPNANVPCPLAYADEHLVVVNKPAGVPTQPGEGHTHDTLLNGLFATYGKRLQNIGKARDFGLVHRLDRPTSGLVVVALTAAAYDHLRAQFAARKVRKTYLALVHGAPQPPSGVERSPLREVRADGRKRAVAGEHKAAQTAVTRYETLVRARGVSLLLCKPETGRLHQIRAHMALRGSPVVGDREYGARGPLDAAFARVADKSLFLHAAEISLKHPATDAPLTVSAPLPAVLLDFLTAQGVACPRRGREAP